MFLENSEGLVETCHFLTESVERVLWEVLPRMVQHLKNKEHTMLAGGRQFGIPGCFYDFNQCFIVIGGEGQIPNSYSPNRLTTDWDLKQDDPNWKPKNIRSRSKRGGLTKGGFKDHC